MQKQKVYQNMLNKEHLHQIHEMTNKQEKKIKQLIKDIANNIEYDFKKRLFALSQNKKILT